MVDANATRVCVVCGAEFPRNGKQTLCSDVCRSERLRVSQKAKRDALVPMRTCAHCSKEFKGQSNKRYCCGRCKDAARPKPDSDSRKRWNAAWAGKNPDRAREAKRESKRRMREVNGRGDRSAEYARRKERLGTAARVEARKRRAEHSQALRMNAAIDRKAERLARVAERERLTQLRVARGVAESTARIKSSPDRYAAELTRSRAKTFKRKTGRAMAADGTATTVVMLGGKRCIYCNCALDDSNRSHDHMTPLARGGVHGAANIAPACRSCNYSKGPKLFHEYVDTLTPEHRARAIKFFEKRNGPMQQGQLLLAA